MIPVLAVLSLVASASSLSFAEGTHVVKKGDVLWKIAEANHTNVSELAALNGLKDPNIILIGQVLKLKEVMEMSKKDQVIAVLNSIETGAAAPIAAINSEKYIQHNLGAKDGLAGFGELLGQLPENSAKVSVVRAFEDGDYVFTHTDYNFFGPKIGFDIFRFEDGLIVEHWDNLAVKSEVANPSGHTQIDGVIEVRDLEKTADNKALVAAFISDILVNGQMEKLQGYFDGNHYIQHNTQIADGLSGLGTALQAMAEAGVTMTYEKTYKVLGQGNFVLAVSEGSFAGEHVAFYDLFRVENDKIAEHWDVIETIPSQDQWMNDNGKF
ncbi:MAG: LysM peptidoglycan-binding domain-containing protein [Clostridia bacterium]|nr:LysM peptidoglycan-binding domain-containing protein [Clostridia bacterium]